MAEAARFARNQLIQKRPHTHISRVLVVRGIARALFRQDWVLAQRLFSRILNAESTSPWA
eukprot:5997803-Pyramimonas_sp.AAC.1